MTTHAKTLQRIPAELHEKLKTLATASGMSVNTIINQACEAYVQYNTAPSIADRLSALEEKLANGKPEDATLESWKRITDGAIGNLQIQMEYVRERLDALEPSDDENDEDEDEETED